MATRTFSTAFQVAGLEAKAVISLREERRLGRPAEATVTVLLADYVDPEELVGGPGLLSIGWAGEAPREIAGTVESVTVIGSAATRGRTAERLVVRVVSQMALLARSEGCRIFQDLDVKEIVSKVLEDHGIAGPSQDWRLTGSYPKREYCVQYDESALAFVSRLLEEEGIYYRSEVKDGAEVVVFEDDSTVAAPIDGDPHLPFRSKTGMENVEDCVKTVSERRRVVSGRFVLRDYDFKRPKLDLTGSAEADADVDLEVYDYPGLYVEPSEGKRLAQVRLEAEQSERATIAIEADCIRLDAGRKITIEGALHAEIDGTYVATEVVHELVPGGAGGQPVYRATASLVPEKVKYRPPRLTPSPVIDGPQSAKIVAPAGSPSEEIHTDEHGRCKVKFHWDLGPDEDDKASCWMRVSQLQTSGSMILPRIGWEVVVEFLEGNPDRPYITGRLYDGLYMPPYALPEGRTRTTMRTASTPGGGGSNEIRFEDKAGGEEIMIHAQYDQTVATANNKVKNVGKNETRKVGVDETVTVGSNQDIKVTKGHQISIGADQSVSVGGNRAVEVNAVTGLTAGGSRAPTVGGNPFEMDGNPLEAILALAAQKAAEIATAKAGEALAAIDAAVQSKVDQAMGPINARTSQAEALGDGMRAVAGGDLGGAAPLMAGAAGLPMPGAFAAGLGGGGGLGGPAATNEAGGAGTSTAGITAKLALDQAVNGAIQHGVSKAKNALGAAMGLDAAGGGGESAANVAGPVGDVDGIDGEDRAKGPGHSLNHVSGSESETAGSLRVVAALNGIMTNVGANMSQNVGAAKLTMAMGNIASSAGGNKDESALGLVVVSRADESETVSGSKTTMVGGAILEKIAGGHSVKAGAPATFIGAFHKIEAATAITLKCGASEVVIDGSGIAITSPIVTITAGKVSLTKAVAEV